MTSKDYSDPEVVEEVIEKARELIGRLGSKSIHKSDIEEVAKILSNALENSTKDHAAYKKYNSIKKDLIRIYPDLDKWMEKKPSLEDNVDYHVDFIQPNFLVDDNWINTLARIFPINDFNKKRLLDLLKFCVDHPIIFGFQFEPESLLLGIFQGLEIERNYAGDWQESIFKKYFEKSMDFNGPVYREFKNSKIVLPVIPPRAEPKIYSHYDPQNPQAKFYGTLFQDLPYKKEIINKYLISIPMWDQTFDVNFEFSNRLITKVKEIKKLLQRKEMNQLEIESIRLKMENVYIDDENFQRFLDRADDEYFIGETTYSTSVEHFHLDYPKFPFDKRKWITFYELGTEKIKLNKFKWSGTEFKIDESIETVDDFIVCKEIEVDFSAIITICTQLDGKRPYGGSNTKAMEGYMEITAKGEINFVLITGYHTVLNELIGRCENASIDDFLSIFDE